MVEWYNLSPPVSLRDIHLWLKWIARIDLPEFSLEQFRVRMQSISQLNPIEATRSYWKNSESENIANFGIMFRNMLRWKFDTNSFCLLVELWNLPVSVGVFDVSVNSKMKYLMRESFCEMKINHFHLIVVASSTNAYINSNHGNIYHGFINPQSRIEIRFQ